MLVGVDGSADSRAALVHAITAAARRGTALRIVSTFSLNTVWMGGWPVGLPVETLREDLHARVRELVVRVRTDPEVTAVPGAVDVPITLAVSLGPPAGRLVDASAGADLLVVGTHGRGAVRGLLLGSVALHCVAQAHCPVLVVRADAPTPLRDTVVVGTDGSPGSREALRTGLAEAARRGGEVTVVSTFEMVDHWVDLSTVGAPSPAQVGEEVRRGVERLVDEALLEHRAASGGTAPEVRTVVAEGPAADVLLRESDDAALLVVGSHGHGELSGVLIGSVGLACAVRSRVPVLVVRPVPAPGAAPAGAPRP